MKDKLDMINQAVEFAATTAGVELTPETRQALQVAFISGFKCGQRETNRATTLTTTARPSKTWMQTFRV